MVEKLGVFKNNVYLCTLKNKEKDIEIEFNSIMKMRRIGQFAVAALLVVSCKVPTQVTYFQDLKNGQVDAVKYTEGIRLKPQDKISIIVKSKNPEISNLFNLPYITGYVGESTTTGSTMNGRISGYTIDANGDIDFPVLGRLHVAGKTREEVADYVKKLAAQQNQASDLVVTVEFLNLHFTVLGEVSHPGEISFGQDRVSIPQALGLAGDLTLYGRRDSVFVYRENNGTRETHVVSLLDGQSLANSPVYYLQQNDVVYVQPNTYRKRQSVVNGNTFQSTSFWLSFTSVLTTIAVFLFK